MSRTIPVCILCAFACIPASRSEPPARDEKPVVAVAKPAATSAPPVAAQAAAVEGRVVLPQIKDAPVKVQRYQVVSRGGQVAMSPALAVVYLEGNFPAPAAPPQAQMRQKDFTFIPALLPVRTGTVVAFPNEDDTYHNVFSYSKAKRFDLGRYLPTERPVPSQVFDKPGLVQLHCDIHEHMRAVILVLDTPHFTLTDPAGNFKLSGLPAGKFKLKAWVSSTETREAAVELRTGSTLKAAFP